MMAVLFARDREEAQIYRTVLEDLHIPALVGDQPASAGVPVLVPESFQERAAELIATHDAVNDGGWEDDEDDEFEDDDDDLLDHPDEDDLDLDDDDLVVADDDEDADADL